MQCGHVSSNEEKQRQQRHSTRKYNAMHNFVRLGVLFLVAPMAVSFTQPSAQCTFTLAYNCINHQAIKSHHFDVQASTATLERPSRTCLALQLVQNAAISHDSNDSAMPCNNNKGNNNNNNDISHKQNMNIKRGNSFHRRDKNTLRSTIKQMFQTAKGLERQGKWSDASDLYEKILIKDPKDAYTHLALARLVARRERKNQLKYHAASASDEIMPEREGRKAFLKGIDACPKSVHLWQAWAVYEESCGNTDKAAELFQEALRLDKRNAYVCHAFGLMEKKLGNTDHAKKLFAQALEIKSTAALVCSMGEILIANKDYRQTRDLYARHVLRLNKEKDKTEVYLSSAWLEEKYYADYDRAKELILLALAVSPASGLAQVALARLEGRIERRQNKHRTSGTAATVRRLENACKNIEEGAGDASTPKDGRLYNTWASMEVKSKNYSSARKILQKGMSVYPNDYSLVQAAGKVEERIGNYTAARIYYDQSLQLRPTAPTMVASALLEMVHPVMNQSNFTLVQQMFEGALSLDPGHGPAYNAYGTAEFGRGNIEKARSVFQRGIQAGTSDPASLYHGYGKLELSLGNVDKAREILLEGLAKIKSNEIGMDTPNRERSRFLIHTLGMLELNTNQPRDALAVFNDGIERCGNSSQLLLGAALCHVKIGKEPIARKLFERSVLSDRTHAQAWQAWGVMETRAGNFDKAVTLFQAGIRSSPTHGALWRAYASMEARRGNIETAQLLYSNGVQKCPNQASLYQGWASLELQQDDLLVAKKLISRALTLDKYSGSGWQIAAQIEVAFGNDGLAGLLLRRGIECAPYDAELYRDLGTLLLVKGKINDSRQVLEKGIEVNPFYAPLYHSLAELEARVFNLEGLAKLNKRTAEIFNANTTHPAHSSSKAWSNKLRAKISPGVGVFAQKIVDDNNDSVSLHEKDTHDLSAAFDSLKLNSMEDDLVEALLNTDSFIEDIPLEFLNKTNAKQ